jgi:hypothetical protein
MSREKEIHVFIVEDDAAATEMMERHFKGTGAITYAAIIDADLRPELVAAIDGAMKDDVNKIPNGAGCVKGKAKRRVIVEDAETGEVLYRNESFSGVLCSMETLKVTPHDEMIAWIEGVHQFHAWGDPAAWLHAIDQMRGNLSDHERVEEICDALAEHGCPETGRGGRRGLQEVRRGNDRAPGTGTESQGDLPGHRVPMHALRG